MSNPPPINNGEYHVHHVDDSGTRRGGGLAMEGEGGDATASTATSTATMTSLPTTLSSSSAASSPSSVAPVPDVLLSLAKDDRYIAEIASLLSRVVVPFASIFLLRDGNTVGGGGQRQQRNRNDGGRNRNDGGHNRNDGGASTTNTTNDEDILREDGKVFLERIRPELNLLAAFVVHSATFVFHGRKNFGAAAASAGIATATTTDEGDTTTKDGESYIISRSLGMESLNLGYRFPSGERRRSRMTSGRASMPTISSTHLRNNNNNTKGFYRFKECILKLVPSWTIGIHRWHRLIILQTLVPYIIHRVGRGGWSKDLGGLVSAFWDRCGPGPFLSLSGGSHARYRSRAAMNNGVGSENNEGTVEDDANVSEEAFFRNDDRLRGSARRRLFEEQRRRMIDSSDGYVGLEGDAEDGRHAVGEANVRGMSRESSSSVGEHDTQSSTLISSSSGNNRSFERRLKKISTLGWNITQRISLAMSSLNHGAHQLPPLHSDNANNAGTNERSLDKYAKLIQWFLRLHLALFYWNGTYPTIAHRLAGAKLRDDVVVVAPHSPTMAGSGAVVANRPTYRPVAGLILCQALVAMAKAAADASIEVAHLVQVSFFRWRRRRRMQQQTQQHHRRNNGRLALEGNGSSFSRTNSERAEYMDMIEERVPGIASSNGNVATAKTKRRSKKKHGRHPPGTTTTTTATQPCGICLNERVDPAAASACGHVFCWNCIQHWVSNVRAECPLCRAQTRPQEVIPLYNYP